jgi:hypothetical protein
MVSTYKKYMKHEDALRLWNAIVDFAQTRAKDPKGPLTKPERIASDKLTCAFRETVGYDPHYVDADLNGKPVEPRWDLAIQFPPKPSTAKQ